ncbi:MAG TPA: DUF3298 and DUF4163 domain-containing protein [Aquaticitalea sp.]|nr:DUF3298 and DUF4163 domain-containing protein [Aquaticitalea sp.]HNU60400.1 DUF3298 and DUF4163 domain-containing protein [Aquaticitalea sp.]
MKKIVPLIIATLTLIACKNDPTPLTFNDQGIESKTNALIDINYPRAEGNKTVAKKINAAVENYMANEINMSEKPNKKLALEDAIKTFDQDYRSFIDDYSDSTEQWEVLIESEVTYESENIVSISVNSYIDTGGAHGNSRVAFLNFDKKTGTILEQEDLISDMEAFKGFVRPFFEKATKSLSDDTIEDPFYGEGFQLPETIGFGPEGLILLYNVYEIASYAQGVTEFSIPLEQAQQYLKIY